MGGATLFAIGDPNENHIDIAVLQDGAIQVTCDRGTPQLFRDRIDAIKVQTDRGDDMVYYRIADRSSPDRQPISLEIDLGAGNDTVELLNLKLGRDRYHFALMGGTGADSLLLPAVQAPGDLALLMDGGPGTDALQVSGLNVAGTLNLTMLGGTGHDSLGISDEEFSAGPDTWILMDGGAGHDTLLARLGFNPQPDPPGRIEFTALGGAGNDLIDIVGFNPQPDPPSLSVPIYMNLHGGDGHDTLLAGLGFHFQPDPLGRIEFTALGGAGNDLIDIVGFNPQPDPPSLSVPIYMNVHGGMGDDLMLLSGQFSGQLHLNMNGADGTDQLQVGELEVGSHLYLNLLGGSGHDKFLLDAVNTLGDTFGALLAGSGNDVLLVLDMTGSGNLSIDIDGGHGNDTYQVSSLSAVGNLNAMFKGSGNFAIDTLSAGSLHLSGIFSDATSFQISDLTSQTELVVEITGSRGDDVIQFLNVSAGGPINATLDMLLLGNDSVIISNLVCADDLTLVLADGGISTKDTFVVTNVSVAGDALIEFDGGAGNDQLTVAVLVVFGDLYLEMLGGSGNDIIQAKDVKVLGGKLKLLMDGEGGNDTIQAKQVQSFEELVLSIAGGNGNDLLEATILDTGKNLDVSMFGDSGSDTLKLAGADAFFGMFVELHGGLGKDIITVSGKFTSVFGDVELSLLGESGDDSLRLSTHQVLSIFQQATVVLNGGPGSDVAWRLQLPPPELIVNVIDCEMTIFV